MIWTNIAYTGQPVIIQRSSPDVFVAITPSPQTLGVGQQIQADSLLIEQNVPQPANIVWSSSNPQVATVDVNGIITGIGPGTATIIATDSTGVSREIVLLVQ